MFNAVEIRESLLVADPIATCELLVGLGDVTVLDGTDTGERLRVAIETRAKRLSCPSCELSVVVKDRDLARIDSGWQSVTSPDPEVQAAADTLDPTQHLLDLCSSETADEFNWNRVNDLIVGLTMMCIGSADIDQELEADRDEEDNVETAWAYPYWCREW